jgi:hypothetical protein
MMAATVAGGSGFFDARKGIQEESSRHLLRNKKSKTALAQLLQEESEMVPLPNSTLVSTMVNEPSKLVDSVTLKNTQEASSTTPVDRKCIIFDKMDILLTFDCF